MSNITSEYPTKTVTDHFFRFAGGESYVLTLEPGERLQESPEFYYVPEPDLIRHRERIFKRNLLLMSTSTRVVTLYPPGESPADKAVKQLADEQERVFNFRRNPRNRIPPREGE